jgi:ribosome maturation factor RimP
MKIEFKVTRKPKGFEEKGIEIIKRQATEVLNKRLENIVCPDHHERPRVTVSIDSNGKITVDKIEGCCQKLIDEAAQAIERAI